MRQVKEMRIKNQTYYFFDDMINIKHFHSNLLKIEWKSYKNIDIYYIGYITMTEFGDCVNPLHSATRHFKEKNNEKYLILDSRDKYEEVLSGIRSEIKTLKKLFYKKSHAKIGINTDDDLPLNKPLKFPTLTIIIRYVFQEGEKLYPQIYLDECLYEL